MASYNVMVPFADIHKISFILFMVCSELYMVLTCLLLKDNRNRLTNALERLAYIKKVRHFENLLGSV